MPREVRMVTARPVDFETVVRAAAAIDTSLAVRAIANGQAIQLVAEDDETIATIEGSRRIDRPEDVARIAAGLGPVAPGEYWSEGWAPWTPGGERGAAILVAVAAALGGRTQRSDA